MVTIQELLSVMYEKGASDLHVTTGIAAPTIRVDGQLMPLPYPPLTPNDTKQLCYSLLTEAQKQRFEEESELDFSFGVKGLSRFRGNLFLQRGAVGGAFRAIPFEVPSLEKLGLPPVVMETCASCPAGSCWSPGRPGRGKSTTLAAMHRQDQQRSGTSTSSRSRTRSSSSTRTSVPREPARGLRRHARLRRRCKHILRQDPDIVLVGEMRDLETIEAALTVAETGHLVFADPAHQLRGADDQPRSSTCFRPTSSRRCARSSRSCSRA